jgi:hypothetical protein
MANTSLKQVGLFVEVSPILKAAIDKYCDVRKCTIRQVVEQGVNIILGADGDEMVRLVVKGKVYTVPLSLALIYESLVDKK